MINKSMYSLYEPNAPKKTTNLSINSDLLKKAEQLNINLSANLEQAPTTQLREKQAQLWLEQNKDVIAAYNQSIHEQGVFSNGLRSL